MSHTQHTPHTGPDAWLNLSDFEAAIGMLLQLEAPDHKRYSASVINRRWCDELRLKMLAGKVSPLTSSADRYLSGVTFPTYGSTPADYRRLASALIYNIATPGRLQLILMLADHLHAQEEAERSAP